MFKRLGKKHSIYACLCFGAFFVYALYYNVFGTNASSMMSFFNIDSAKQGFILSIQAIGGIIVSLVLAVLGERFNKLKVLWRGLFVLAIASAALGSIPLYVPESHGYVLALFFVVFAGIGFTMIDIMMNASIPEVFKKENDVVFPLVHASYSVGSMVSPLMTSLLISFSNPLGYGLPFIVCAAVCLITGILHKKSAVSIMPFTPYEAIGKKSSFKRKNDFSAIKNYKLWMFFLSGVFYFAFQVCVSAWFPSYATEILGLSNAAGAMGVTIFFGMSLLARLTAPLIYKFMSKKNYYIWLGGLSGVIYLTGYLSQNAVIMYTAIVIGGYFQGLMSPVLINLCCEYFPGNTATASSAIILSINSAALIGPALTGSLSQALGFTAAMCITAVWLTLASVTAALIYIIKPSDKKGQADGN